MVPLLAAIEERNGNTDRHIHRNGRQGDQGAKQRVRRFWTVDKAWPQSEDERHNHREENCTIGHLETIEMRKGRGQRSRSSHCVEHPCNRVDTGVGTSQAAVQNCEDNDEVEGSPRSFRQCSPRVCVVSVRCDIAWPPTAKIIAHAAQPSER